MNEEIVPSERQNMNYKTMSTKALLSDIVGRHTSILEKMAKDWLDESNKTNSLFRISASLDLYEIFKELSNRSEYGKISETPIGVRDLVKIIYPISSYPGYSMSLIPGVPTLPCITTCTADQRLTVLKKVGSLLTVKTEPDMSTQAERFSVFDIEKSKVTKG